MKETCPFCDKKVLAGAVECTKCGAQQERASTDYALIVIMGGAMAMGVGVSFSHNQALGWGTIAVIAGAIYFLVLTRRKPEWVKKD
ncbi:hypothetical protein CBP31_02100 [Oceanisphaera profunda]|uniref:Uncharacterized protein n=1 Tax=Oceanisphaera profunda TaxID=1416627 RepID=A0A1Y0D225_9GAMM|nr:hypothetical protein [Oceanisphaera profunda]ART81568.1 hypothetical protein CBP31_02100 [Oceanisphaera profunda]